MYSGEYDACDVTLSVYPHRASFKKNMPADHSGNRWTSIPKVAGSIPTVVRHIFQARPVWIYTQSNITSIISFHIFSGRLSIGNHMSGPVRI